MPKLYISERLIEGTALEKTLADVATQTLSVSGTSAQSSAFNAGTNRIRIISDDLVHVLISSNPTATTSNTLIFPGDAREFDVTPGHKIAAISAATSVVYSVTLDTTIAGERNVSSSTEDYLSARMPVKPVVLTSTSAVDINGSTTANDMHLAGIYITLNGGGAVTATVAGFSNESGTAKNVVFTGSTTVDTFHNFGSKHWINTLAKLSITASVADKVVVLYRAAS